MESSPVDIAGLSRFLRIILVRVIIYLPYLIPAVKDRYPGQEKEESMKAQDCLLYTSAGHVLVKLLLFCIIGHGARISA